MKPKKTPKQPSKKLTKKSAKTKAPSKGAPSLKEPKQFGPSPTKGLPSLKEMPAPKEQPDTVESLRKEVCRLQSELITALVRIRQLELELAQELALKLAAKPKPTPTPALPFPDDIPPFPFPGGIRPPTRPWRTDQPRDVDWPGRPTYGDPVRHPILICHLNGGL